MQTKVWQSDILQSSCCVDHIKPITQASGEFWWSSLLLLRSKNSRKPLCLNDVIISDYRAAKPESGGVLSPKFAGFSPIIAAAKKAGT
jgi:hypothetical protein